jgi:hypothetical protein
MLVTSWAAAKVLATLSVDVLELGVAVPVLRALCDLGVGLEAVAH